MRTKSVLLTHRQTSTNPNTHTFTLISAHTRNCSVTIMQGHEIQKLAFLIAWLVAKGNYVLIIGLRKALSIQDDFHNAPS